MADQDYKKELEQAKTDVSSLITLVKNLEEQLKTTLTQARQLGGAFKPISPNETTSQIKKQGEQVETLTAKLDKLSKLTEKIAAKKNELNNLELEQTNKIIRARDREFEKATKQNAKFISQKEKEKRARESQVNKESAFSQRMIAQKNKEIAATKRSTAATKRNIAARKQATRGIFAMGRSLKALISAFGIIGGIQLFANFVKDAFNIVKTFDSLGFALEKITKSSFDAAISERFILEITQSFGTELVTTTNRWIKFLAAAKQSGLTLRDTENIFRSMTKAAGVLGLKTDELTGIYLALEQMLSKGKVTTEELRRQLGERLPGAMGIMAGSLGVTISQLDKMLKKGEVLSAEALPKFAKAVEIAFGIESVKKVDTLVAAQSRLTNAWKIFVKNVFSDSSLLRGIFEGLANSLSMFGEIFFTDQQKRQFEIIKAKVKFEEKMFNISKEAFNKTLKEGEKFEDVRKKIRLKQNEIAENLLKESFEEQDKILNNELAVLTTTLLNHQENIEKLEIADANKKVERIVKVYNIYSRIITNAEKKISELQSKRILGIGSNAGKVEIERLKAIIAANRDNLILSTAQLEVIQKIREVGKVSTFEGDKDKFRVLKTINDSENQIKIELLKNQIERNKRSLEDEQTTAEEKIRLAFDTAKKLNEIAELQAKNDIMISKNSRDDKIKALEKSFNDGKVDIKDFNNQIADLKKEADQKEVMADLKKGAIIEKNLEDLNEKLLFLETELLKEKLSIIQDEANIKIIEAKKIFNESTRNAQARVKLENKLKKIAIESTNAQIKAQIVLLEAKKESLLLEGENVDSLIRAINKLKTGLDKFFDTSKADLFKDIFKTVTDTFADVFDIDISKFDFLFDGLGNSMSDWADLSKELIGSVLDASLKRYELELIEAQRTRDLILNNEFASEEQKESARKRFDAKERQIKLARAKQERENTLIKIAVDTAAAIVKVTAQAGVLAPFIIPSIIAIGLAQAAIVASQPLPKFEGGTTDAPKGWALTQEKRAEPITDMYGRLKTMGSDSGAMLTPLSKGDKVYKSKEDFFRQNSGDAINKAVWNMNMASNGEELSKRFVDNSLLNEMKGLRKDNIGFRKEIKKLGSRPINVHNIVEIEDKRAY